MQTVNYNFVISVIFKTAAAAILDFQIFEIFLRTIPCRGPMCVTMPNFIKIGHTIAKIWRLYGFQNGGRPPYWICEIHFLTVGEVKRTILHQHTKYNTKIQYKICKAPCCRGFRGAGEQDS